MRLYPVPRLYLETGYIPVLCLYLETDLLDDCRYCLSGYSGGSYAPILSFFVLLSHSLILLVSSVSL